LETAAFVVEACLVGYLEEVLSTKGMPRKRKRK
jgi:hypothetical protein